MYIYSSNDYTKYDNLKSNNATCDNSNYDYLNHNNSKYDIYIEIRQFKLRLLRFTTAQITTNQYFT